MLLTASRTSPSARLLQTRSVGSTVLRSPTLLQSRCGQTREFNFGPWSSSSTSSESRQSRRRHRVFRYQYLESLNRTLSWENNPKAAIKKAMAGFGRPADSGKYVNVDQVKSWSDDLSGVRPGMNIEDVERSAIDHLIRGDQTANIRTTTPNNMHHFNGRRRARAATPEDVLQTTAQGEGATYIDPITNRRASKKSSMTGPTARYEDLEGYEPTDFVDVTTEAHSAPKYEDLDKYGPVKDGKPTDKPSGKPKYSDLNEYEPVIDERPVQDESPKYDDLDNYGPVRWNEPDGERKPTPEEDSKKYNDLHKYSAPALDDPFTQQELTAEEKSKAYDDLDQYKAVHWNEPDGLRKETPEELSKNYDDLHKYEAVRWNEPDGLREPTPEELSKNYQDLESYGPVAWSEPDGLRRLTPEEESKQYDDLDAYDAPFEVSQSILEAYEKTQMDATPRGKPLAPKVDAPVEDFASKYDDLNQYGPVQWNEPDGLRKLTPEELSKNYEDLHLYGAVQFNEPDGLRQLTPEEQSKQYQDTRLYAPRDLSPRIMRVHPEEASKAYKDLSGYHHFENADATSARVHPEEASKQYADLDKYTVFENDGPETERIHPEQASKEYKDLSEYPTAGYEEAANFQHTHPEELTKKYTDLGSYKPTGFVSQAQAYPVHPEEATKVYQDLNRYTAVGFNEPNGKVNLPPDEVARGLREFDSKAGPQDTTDRPSVTYQRERNRFFPDFTETSIDFVDSRNADKIRAATLRRAHESSQQKLAEAKEQQQAKASQQLTGNFVRDFPEEFTTSWSTEHSPSKSTLFPKNQAEDPGSSAEASSVDQVDIGSMDESFPTENVKLQPALDRYGGKVFKDPYSHEPQGLQTSFSEECGRSTMPIMEKHYKPTSKEPETATYKILAYDSTSQTINVAEASSALRDDETPMALSDALLQLSSPAKFLPYFKPLQARGYEVVSGSGDVLIFRKMGPATAQDEELEVPAAINPPRVNPIDMMGRSAIGSFASPTGFVNYDTLSEPMDRPAPPYRSTGNNRDELASNKQTKPRKKRGLGRKLVLGTAGVAGSAYAAAVLTEYFSTRGRDPERPRTRRP
ncbi:hypothetical protein NM208_g11646 [Fusarium decemcellulare]|uniref:Uncharacterized protein n=1 Tax=Fusarium decemcellulare TaxID=57161 RepID=A0ACC1RT61_9HYPO|nr:hypothetical protein NM208_g11646 [Fusarium decemcellulare]